MSYNIFTSNPNLSLIKPETHHLIDTEKQEESVNSSDHSNCKKSKRKKHSIEKEEVHHDRTRTEAANVKSEDENLNSSAVQQDNNESDEIEEGEYNSEEEKLKAQKKLKKAKKKAKKKKKQKKAKTFSTEVSDNFGLCDSVNDFIDLE